MKQVRPFGDAIKRILRFFHVNRRRWLIGLPVLSLIMTIFSLLCLPDTIPLHYDSAWNVDRYGSKYELLLMPGITVLVSWLLGVFWRNREDFYAADIRILFTLILLDVVQFFILILAWHNSFI